MSIFFSVDYQLRNQRGNSADFDEIPRVTEFLHGKLWSLSITDLSLKYSH